MSYLKTKGMQHKVIGEVEIPQSYFQLTKEQKDDLCETMYDVLLKAIYKVVGDKNDSKKFLINMLESSIITNEENENYEVCAFFCDIQKYINEERN